MSRHRSRDGQAVTALIWTRVFLTNNFTLPALTIAQIYKCRWQVELFFKWIKQHLRIKAFYGTSENAVKTQIWIAVSVYVLVAIVRKRLGLEASLYQIRLSAGIRNKWHSTRLSWSSEKRHIRCWSRPCVVLSIGGNACSYSRGRG